MPARRTVSRKTGNKKQEERGGTRVPYKTSLIGFNLLQPGVHSPKESFEGEIIDLSESGIGLSMNEGINAQKPSDLFPLLEEGTLVRLRVPITESRVTMPVLGQIIWKKTLNQKKGIRAGIRFII